MNPYTDIVTGKEGKIVQNLVRKREESDQVLKVAKRPRAETNKLLPPQKPGQPPAEPLKREDEIRDYTRDRLESGLRYICETLRRDVTPRTIAFLNLAKEHYKAALEEEVPTEISCAVVQAIDQAYDSAAFYHKVRDPGESQFLSIFVKLRELENLLNYGDYLGHNVQQFRASLNEEANKKGPQQAELKAAASSLGSSRTWVTIANELEGVNADELRKHVWTVCDTLKLDSAHMENVIKEWGKRNKLAHNQCREFIKEHRWHDLAQQLCRDTRELPNIYADEVTMATFEKAMLFMRDEFFDVLDPQDANSWFPNAKAKELVKQKVEKKQRKDQQTSM